MKQNKDISQKQNLIVGLNKIISELADNLIVDNINNKLAIFLKNNQKTSICVDFTSGKLLHSLKFSINKSHPLAKATNLNSITQKPTVLDATAGLGKDAIILAKLGLKVFLLERCKILHALLADGINRAINHVALKNIVNNLRLLTAQNSVNFMQRLKKLVENGKTQLQPDIIYLDPMFPKKNKTALVKKEMQILQLLHKDYDDAEELLAPAFALAKYRVIVKRPAKANSLTDKKPNYQLIGKTCRYDVYTPCR